MYVVSYSGRVIEALRSMILRHRHRAHELLAALREIDRRLKIYPQFGQPLRNLTVTNATLWIGVVPPLVVQYVLDEDKRQVLVVLPPTLMTTK